jgi:hypothetical protein
VVIIPICRLVRCHFTLKEEWLGSLCAADKLAPENVPIATTLRNPAVPDTLLLSTIEPITAAVNNQRTTTSPNSQFVGIGPERRFLTPWEQAEANPGYPARPTAGSIMDLDLVDERCNFGSGKVCPPTGYRISMKGANGSTFEIVWNYYEWEEDWIMAKGSDEEITSEPTNTFTTKIHTRNNKWTGHPNHQYPVHRDYQDHHYTSKTHTPSRHLSILMTHAIHSIQGYSTCFGLVHFPINHTWPSRHSCLLKT